MKDKKEVWIVTIAFITLVYFAATSSPTLEQEQAPRAPFAPRQPQPRKIIKTNTAGYICPRIQKMDDPRKLKRRIRTIQKKVDADTKTLRTVAKTPEYKQRLKNSIIKNRKLLMQYRRRLTEVQAIKK